MENSTNLPAIHVPVELVKSNVLNEVVHLYLYLYPLPLAVKQVPVNTYQKDMSSNRIVECALVLKVF
jgi:hypothetical protein